MAGDEALTVEEGDVRRRQALLHRRVVRRDSRFHVVAWGPRLPNGHRTLMLMSDDNFSPHQTTQLLAFEVWL